MTPREAAPHGDRKLVVILTRLRLALSAFLLCAVVRAGAADTFVVEDIRLEGLQRITAGTVFNYLPIQVGDTVDDTRTAGAVRALFRTGFFRDVRLERDGDTLVVSVVERPSIGSIEFSGNEDLDTEDLLSALEQMGFAQGRVFNRSIFDQVQQELHRTYFAAGKYGARVTGTVTPLERNRVAVRFEISEGVAAKIRQINVVGNAAFDDDDLLDEFELETTRFLLLLLALGPVLQAEARGRPRDVAFVLPRPGLHQFQRRLHASHDHAGQGRRPHHHQRHRGGPLPRTRHPSPGRPDRPRGRAVRARDRRPGGRVLPQGRHRDRAPHR